MLCAKAATPVPERVARKERREVIVVPVSSVLCGEKNTKRAHAKSESRSGTLLFLQLKPALRKLVAMLRNLLQASAD
ncbi:MAG: hypothetical protein ACK55Z_36070, partial [bacterium]